MTNGVKKITGRWTKPQFEYPCLSTPAEIHLEHAVQVQVSAINGDRVHLLVKVGMSLPTEQVVKVGEIITSTIGFEVKP